MSIDHVSRVLALPPNINGSDRMVLFVLAEAANTDTDECWPSTATIAKRAGLRQERYVAKAIAALVTAGLIEVDPNGCPDHRIRADRRPNLFRMIGPMAVPHGDARRAGSPGSGVRDAPSGGARRASAGVRDAQTSLHIEPEVEPEVEPEPADAGFAAVWSAYPKRHGKKLGRADALAQWLRLRPDERERARRNLGHYASACDRRLALAMDAVRWLRPGHKGGFEEWDDPAVDTSKPVPRNAVIDEDRSQKPGRMVIRDGELVRAD